MQTLVTSAHSDGLSCHLVTIESGFLKGFSGVQMLGCASDICRDGKERARSALELLGLELPQKKLMINMAPADLPKNGNQFDLPLAVSLAILITDTAPFHDPSRWLFAAELGLDGRLRPVKNIVSFAIAAVKAGLSGIVVARENAAALESLVDLAAENFASFSRLSFHRLEDVLAWLFKNADPQPHEIIYDPPESIDHGSPDFSDMLLTPELKRLAVCVAAGHHSLLLQGSPGTGKSMFASRLPSLLPKMTPKEHLEALQIHSILSERLSPAFLEGTPPYRAPHHGASANAVLGNHEHPGELSLAHGGILFLDEVTEFRRDLLEALREPLESGIVRLARTTHRVNWDCRVVLLAACNPCPCGFSGSSRRTCSCSQKKVLQYRQRLSGPILERIDLHVWMPEPSNAWESLLGTEQRQESDMKELRELVRSARLFAAERHEKLGIHANRDISSQHIATSCNLSGSKLTSLLAATVPKSASNRVVLKMMRVARTLADIDANDTVEKEHMKEAVSWQQDAILRRLGWRLPEHDQLRRQIKESRTLPLDMKKDHLDPQTPHWSYQ